MHSEEFTTEQQAVAEIERPGSLPDAVATSHTAPTAGRQVVDPADTNPIGSQISDPTDVPTSDSVSSSFSALESRYVPTDSLTETPANQLDGPSSGTPPLSKAYPQLHPDRNSSEISTSDVPPLVESSVRVATSPEASRKYNSLDLNPQAPPEAAPTSTSESAEDPANSHSPDTIQDPSKTSIYTSDDDDDDYDPETILYDSSGTNPAAPAVTTADPTMYADSTAPSAHSLLQSVLAQFGSDNGSPIPKTGQTDLHKILSTIQSAPKSEPDHHQPGSRDTSIPGEDRGDGDILVDTPLNAQERTEYEQFLQDEEEYVAGGKWNRFPSGSRLFVGNLPSDQLSKSQVYRIFQKHGRIAQISMKQAYGFVQFHTPESCVAALAAEQNLALRGTVLREFMRWHILIILTADLEISKPQAPKSNFPTQIGFPQRQRSRSPLRRGSGVRYDERGYGRGGRRRSPPRRYRDRSPTRRATDIHVLLLDRLDPAYVDYVESLFRRAGYSVSVENANPSIPTEIIVQQIAHGGALAVVTLDQVLQQSAMISLEVFHRDSSGAVRFSRYQGIAASVALDIVGRARNGAVGLPPIPVSNRGRNSVTANRQVGTGPLMPTDSGNANLLGTLQNMDPESLRVVLNALQQQQHQQQQQEHTHPHQRPHQHPHQQQRPHHGPVPRDQSLPIGFAQDYGYRRPPHSSSSYNGPGYDSPSYAGPTPSAQQQSGQDVKSIMEQLAMLQGRK